MRSEKEIKDKLLDILVMNDTCYRTAHDKSVEEIYDKFFNGEQEQCSDSDSKGILDDGWRDFSKDKPQYNKIKNGNLETEYILVSTGRGEMAVVSHSINYRKDGTSYEWWDVSGVSGYEWDFDLQYDVKYWKPIEPPAFG